MSDFISTTDAIAAKRGKRPTPKRVIGIIVGVIVGAALCIGSGFGALGLLNDALGKKHQAPIALSEQTVLNSFNTDRLSPPDVSGYAHLTTDNLLGPRYDNLSIGEIVDVDGEAPHRDVTAVATFENGYLTISAPLTARFTYDEEAIEWRLSEQSLGAPAVKPLRAPAVASIESDLLDLLARYDAELASTFAGASMLTKASFSETGGTADVQLTKRSEDGKSVTTCTVAIKVSWVDGKGWQTTIVSASKPEQSKTSEAPATLTSNPGDVVELSGIIEASGESTVLKTSSPIVVSLGGAQGVTAERFNLVTTNPNLSVEVGAHVTIRGTITAISNVVDTPFEIDVIAV